MRICINLTQAKLAENLVVKLLKKKTFLNDEFVTERSRIKNESFRIRIEVLS